MNKCLLLGLSFVLCFAAWTQKPMWKHFGVKEGLYEPTVNTFAQDQSGIMWLGTPTGLIRFDGRSFVKLKTSGEHPYITSLVVGKDGTVWAGSRDGIWKYNAVKKVFAKVRSKVLHRQYVYSICWNRDSTQLMIAGNGAWAMDKEGQARKMNLDNKITVLFEVNAYGNEFIALAGTRIIKFDLQGKSSVLLESRELLNYAMLASGKSLLAVSRTEICKVDLGTSKSSPVPFKLPFSKLPVDAYHAIYIDKRERIWINAHDTLFQFSSLNDRFPVRHYWVKENPYSIARSFCLFTDRDGNTWTNSEGKGISVLLSKTSNFYFNTFEEMNSRYIWATSYDAGERIFYYGAEKGMQFLDLNQNSPARQTIPNPPVKTIFTITNIQQFDDQHLVISTYGSGAWLLNKKTLRYSLLSRDLPLKVNAVYQTRQDVLVFTNEGLYRGQKGLGFKLNQNTLDLCFLGSARTPNGNIYTSDDRGLYCKPAGSSYFKPLIKFASCKEINSAVLCISAMENGDVLLGTINNGLFVYKHSGRKIVKVHLDPDPASIYGMSLVSENELLLTTSNGIYLYNLAAQTTQTYNISNLLPFNDFNQFGYFSNPSMISLTGSGGIIAAAPRDFRNLFHDHASIVVQDKLQIIHALTVPAGDQSFSVNAGIGLKQIEHKPDFEYRLKGLDTKWHEMDASGNIAYNYVPPGNYVLEIRMHDPNHILASQTKRIPVEVIPLWWQTLWFQAGIWLLSLVLMVALIRYFSRLRLNWKIRRMEAEQKINNERMRISRELHDNVGSQLSYLITGLEASEMMLQKDNTENLTRNLGNLQESARESMQQLRDAIWALNKEEISASLLIERFSQWTSKMTEQHDVTIHLSSSIGQEIELDSLKTLNIFRILQEAVHNILKHAQASRAEIHFSLKEGTMLVSVQDNGCGFESLPSAGNGLKNMQARAKELGAKLEIDSQKGIGTALMLTIVINTSKG